MLLLAAPASAATPNTVITAGPSGLFAKTTATFKFKATVSGATFQCKIDAKDWVSCDSPKKYKKLRQGNHTFQVRARKGHKTDKTPATRTFTVDTLPPETTVDEGPGDPLDPTPDGYTEDQTPSSTFHSNEAGSFECRVTSASSSPAFEPCESPFTPASPLPRDVFYTFETRATDEAGNVDPTPGTWDFSVETPITEDQQTADLAAAFYFPDTATMDVPASCGGSTPIDCPGGTPLAADDDQLSVTSVRSVVAGPPNSHRYDLTVDPYSVQTLSPIVAAVPLVGDCNLTINSANGSPDHWTVTESLTFVTGYYTDGAPGGKFIAPQNTSVTGLESADLTLGGSFACNLAGSELAFFVGLLADQYSSIVGADTPLCAKLGPGYFEPCPEL